MAKKRTHRETLKEQCSIYSDKGGVLATITQSDEIRMGIENLTLAEARRCLRGLDDYIRRLERAGRQGKEEA